MSTGAVRARAGDLLGLGGFLVLCLAIAAIGGWVTADSVGTWYWTLQKPVFNPPDWVFAPVWILLGMAARSICRMGSVRLRA